MGGGEAFLVVGKELSNQYSETKRLTAWLSSTRLQPQHFGKQRWKASKSSSIAYLIGILSHSEFYTVNSRTPEPDRETLANKLTSTQAQGQTLVISVLGRIRDLKPSNAT